MKRKLMTLEEIRLRGLEALASALGPEGMIRFLQQFETGSGDYTKERHKWLDRYSVEDLAAKIRQHKQDRAPTRRPGRSAIRTAG